MFATFPCDAEGKTSLSPSACFRPRALSLSTPESSSDTGSESTAPPRNSVGSGSQASSLPSPSVSAPPSPSPRVSPGLPVPVQFPSAGSMLHDSGQCRPCGWFWKPRGCQNGRECGHCHFCPPCAVKERKKAKIAAAKGDISMLTSTLAATTDQIPAHSLYLLSQAPPLSLANLLAMVECSQPAGVPVLARPLASAPLPSYSAALLFAQSLPPPPLTLAFLAPPVPPAPPCQSPRFSQFISPPRVSVAPTAPPCQSPRLMLQQELPPPPALSPSLALSPGALAHSLAMACMDEEGDGEDAPVRLSDSHPTLTSSRVTLELSTALPVNTSPPISQGSALHAEGNCTACAWFWKPQGCGNAQDCAYCHLCPQGELRRRRKAKNSALRAHAAATVAAGATQNCVAHGSLEQPRFGLEMSVSPLRL